MRGFSIREHAPSILVAILSSAFGVTLLLATGALATIIRADRVTGESGTVAFLLSIVAIVFIVIALYVAAIVTANTFATIIAGRTRTIALLRLIGASALAQRRAVAREGLLVGSIGGVLGTGIGIAVTAALLGLGVLTGSVPDLQYDYLEPVLVLPPIAVLVTTWLASWVGSRRVLSVSPMQATGAAEERSMSEAAGRRGRNATSITLFVVGTLIMGGGMLVGLVSPLGILIAVVGGMMSFSGVVAGAQLVMPPALRVVGRMLGASAPARLAAENALRYPERSSRTTIGLVIGVTLITTFVVALSSYYTIIRQAQQADPEYYAGIDEALAITISVFTILIGFSALIAAVGMVNNLPLSVLQRTRELGLLRALGFTAGQVRRMILAESAQLTGAAVLVGLLLGILYGWAGALSLLGAITGGSGPVLPTVPVPLLALVALCAGVLTIVASVAPSRRATRLAPVAALAVD